MEIGEVWGYGTSDTPGHFLCVRVLKIEERQTVVAFVDDDGVDGLKRRVLTRNLRIPWDDRWEFLRAARIRKADENAEKDAAELVFNELIPYDVAEVYGRLSNVSIYQPEELSTISGLSPDELTKPYVDGFTIGRAAAGGHADQILRQIDQEEREDRYRAVRDALNSDHAWWYINDEKARLERIALDAGRLTERRNSVLRTWAGQAAVDRAHENDQLRVDLLATGATVRKAILALEGMARTQRDHRLVEELHALLPTEDH